MFLISGTRIRFKGRWPLQIFFCCLLFWGWGFFAPVGAGQTDQNPSPEDLDMIAQRMRRLSNSLGQMPDPPQLDRKIYLPELEVSSSETSTADQKDKANV